MKKLKPQFKNKIKKKDETNMSENIEAPIMTDNKEVNTQLMMYFWWLILLSFLGQLIGYYIQFLSSTIDMNVLKILSLGAIQTLLIGGAVKLVQKQMNSVSDKYNNQIRKSKIDAEKFKLLESENAQIKKQLNDRDAELISIKTKALD